MSHHEVTERNGHRGPMIPSHLYCYLMLHYSFILPLFPLFVEDNQITRKFINNSTISFSLYLSKKRLHSMFKGTSTWDSSLLQGENKLLQNSLETGFPWVAALSGFGILYMQGDLPAATFHQKISTFLQSLVVTQCLI